MKDYAHNQDAPVQRERWQRGLSRRATLAMAWMLFLACLPAPGVDFLTPRVPMFVVFIVIFGIPQAFPLWLALLSFILSPMFVRVRPSGLLRWVWRIPPIAMLGAWVLPALNFLQPDIWTPVYWGYYIWAVACTVAWVATLLAPSDLEGQRPTGGFPVIVHPRGDPK